MENKDKEWTWKGRKENERKWKEVKVKERKCHGIKWNEMKWKEMITANSKEALGALDVLRVLPPGLGERVRLRKVTGKSMSFI